MKIVPNRSRVFVLRTAVGIWSQAWVHSQPGSTNAQAQRRAWHFKGENITFNAGVRTVLVDEPRERAPDEPDEPDEALR